ncbi:cytochrome P450 2D14-like [Anolis sagrei]|uniref:cytochrome P450 2D14-like n=1 Tax=Anolis sagrei TaxID=38937 RepID=UPI0035204496
MGLTHCATSGKINSNDFTGVLVASCDNGWREQKRFCVSNLKRFGMGKKTLEKRVCEEAGYLCAELKSQEGFTFDPHDFIYTAVGNIICRLVLGDRFEYHNKNFLALMHSTEGFMKAASNNLSLVFFCLIDSLLPSSYLRGLPLAERVPTVPSMGLPPPPLELRGGRQKREEKESGFFPAGADLELGLATVSSYVMIMMRAWWVHRNGACVFFGSGEQAASPLLNGWFIIYISWFSYLPGPQQKIKKDWDGFNTIIKEIVNEHKKTRDPNNPRGLIDAFLEEIEKAEGNTETSFNEQNLIQVLLDLIAANTQATTATLTWGLIFMVLHPEVQKRVHEEIDTVIGGVKSITMMDQSNLPYTTAVIHEIQRYADVTPVIFPYVACNDTEVGGFVIPKETLVINHLSSVLKDETMWEKPHEFYPDHFLDANGQFVKREAFLPFSLGRHACFGEPLAKMELFIFFTSLMQRFTFRIPENAPRPSEERRFALVVFPLPFQIFAFPR